MDWFDAVVIDNSILGDGFLVDSNCHFRRVDDIKKTFEIFNLHSIPKVLSGQKCKSQLRSVRDSKGNVVRSSDQGYINWKYSQIKGKEDE